MADHIAYGIPISWFLTVGAILFALGLYGMMIRRSAIGMLLSVELMLNAANINLVAFGSYLKVPVIAGQVFAIFVITLAAAEAAIGLAIVINIYRNEQHIDADKIQAMKL
jgi:NADH-quinone oxidoreductase subunit K